jgi:DNA-binding transcriptional regulator YbjK
LTSFNALTKPDIRTLLVLLVLSFLTAGDLRLKTSVVETKGLVAGVFKGLNEDAEVVVNLVLETVGRELVLDRRVGLEARRNVFDEACINELVKLYDYPLPVLEDDVDLPASHPSLSVHRFFRLISHWLADQIATSPIGRSSGPQRVLSTLLRALKVTEDSVQRELGLEILAGAPVLAGAFWAKFPSSLDPRLSSRWVSAITFATRVVGLPVPATLSLPSSSHQHATPASTAPPSVTSILDTILPPSTTSTLNRAWYTKALTHETPLVSFLSSLFLLSILQKAAAVLAAMAETSRVLEEETAQGRWATQCRKVREELRARLPDPAIVVGLMTKTAAAAAGDAPASASGGGKKGSKSKSEDVEMMSTATVVPAAAGSEGALLRTNVALRILFLYHRVVPQLISTLKFDFAKLPQTYARRPPTTTTTSGGGEEGEEGIRAISSAYALRLAAAHSTASSIVSFNRPGDHFKQSLVPLFQLYRIPSTPSNRSLLREILKRQLDTPLLLGSSSSTTAANDDDEIEVWLRALPVPTVEADEVEVVLSFFEHAVQKTLTSPLKPIAAADSGHQAAPPLLSPLMQNVLAALPATLAADEEEDDKAQQVLAFFRDVVLHMCAQQQTLAAAQSAVQQFNALVLAADKAITVVAEPTVQLLEDCLSVLSTTPSTPGAFQARDGLAATLSTLLADADARALREFVSTLSPMRENVFAALITPSTSETALDALRAVLAAMPIPLVLLHARESDFDTAATRRILVQLVQQADFCVPAAQVALHRLGAGFSNGVAVFVRDVDASVRETSGAKAAIAERVASKDSLLGVFAEPGQSFETLQGESLHTFGDLATGI